MKYEEALRQFRDADKALFDAFKNAPGNKDAIRVAALNFATWSRETLAARRRSLAKDSALDLL